MVQCQLCNANVDSSKSFTLRKCGHVYCHPCLTGHIDKNLSCKIKCPLSSCNEYIRDQIIRKCLSNEKIKEYEKFLTSAIPNEMKCLTKDCLASVIVKSDDIVFHCTYCDRPNCTKCRQRHYGNDPCMQNANENAMEEAATLTISQHKRNELLSQFQEDGFVPNPESFKCGLCDTFILPREGMIIRRCLHSICKGCFIEAMKSVEFIDKLGCPFCERPLDGREITNAIGVNKLMDMSIKKARPKYFACKHPECTGLWNRNNCKGSFTCPICKHVNCMDCEDVHEKMSCEKFRQGKRYKDMQVAMKKLGQTKSVQCNCGQLLIQDGGCGALHCNNCGSHICAFTGKLAGDNGLGSCGCRSDKPCHPSCKYGCYPDVNPKSKK